MSGKQGRKGSGAFRRRGAANVRWPGDSLNSLCTPLPAYGPPVRGRVGVMAEGRRWGAWIAALAAAIVCAGPACAQVQGASVRLGVGPSGTRVVIDSPGKITASPANSEGRRMVFDVSGIDLAQPLAGMGAGLVTNWRLGRTETGAQLTLELTHESEVAHRFSIPPTSEVAHFRYVIDLTSAIAGVRITEASAAGAETHVLATPRARKVVVIDAGHGGHDPGAQVGEVNEKDITLAAALRLRHRLERSGRYRVVMTRASDLFVPLEARVRIARRAGADLFIALHPDPPAVTTHPPPPHPPTSLSPPHTRAR